MAKYSLRSRIPTGDDPIQALADNGIVGRVHNCRQQTIGALCLLALCDVGTYPDDALCLSVVVVENLRRGFYPTLAAVAASDAKLDVKFGVSGNGLLQSPIDICQILGIKHSPPQFRTPV